MKKLVSILMILLFMIMPITYSKEINVLELFDMDPIIPDTELRDSEGTTTFFYAGLNLVATNKEEIEYHYLDGIGSNVKGRHLPFGQELRDANERFEFTGKEFDDDSGLNYFNARYYDPSIGRFLSVDPKEDEPPYQYVYNNPMNYVDPTGRGGFKKGWAKFLKFFGIDIDDAAKHADDAARLAAKQTDDGIDAFMDEWSIEHVQDMAGGNKQAFEARVASQSPIMDPYDVPREFAWDWGLHHQYVVDNQRIIARGMGVKSLPEGYVHDITKMFPEFAQANKNLVEFERAMKSAGLSMEEIKRMPQHQILVQNVRSFHSQYEYHHLKALFNSGLSQGDIEMHIVEHVVDHFHSAVFRFRGVPMNGGAGHNGALELYITPGQPVGEGYYDLYQMAVDLAGREFVDGAIRRTYKKLFDIDLPVDFSSTMQVAQ